MEFALPPPEQVPHSYETQTADLESVLHKLVRVFIDDGTLCPRDPVCAR